MASETEGALLVLAKAGYDMRVRACSLLSITAHRLRCDTDRFFRAQTAGPIQEGVFGGQESCFRDKHV